MQDGKHHVILMGTLVDEGIPHGVPLMYDIDADCLVIKQTARGNDVWTPVTRRAVTKWIDDGILSYGPLGSEEKLMAFLDRFDRMAAVEPMEPTAAAPVPGGPVPPSGYEQLSRKNVDGVVIADNAKRKRKHARAFGAVSAGVGGFILLLTVLAPAWAVLLWLPSAVLAVGFGIAALVTSREEEDSVVAAVIGLMFAAIATAFVIAEASRLIPEVADAFQLQFHENGSVSMLTPDGTGTVELNDDGIQIYPNDVISDDSADAYDDDAMDDDDYDDDAMDDDDYDDDAMDNDDYDDMIDDDEEYDFFYDDDDGEYSYDFDDEFAEELDDDEYDLDDEEDELDAEDDKPSIKAVPLYDGTQSPRQVPIANPSDKMFRQGRLG